MENKNNNVKNKKTSKWFEITLTVFKSLILLGILVGFLGGGLALGLIAASLQDIPELNRDLLESPNLPSTVVDRNGEFVGDAYDERRIRLSIEEVPQDLLNAFLATEDRSFYDHPGFDIKGLGRAALSNLQGGTVSGGSTLTQQLAKQVFLDGTKELERKIKELYLALQIEKLYTKDEIFEFYLNSAVDYAWPDRGIGAAARGIFGKSVEELTLSEMALIAGIPNWPAQYDPRYNFDRAEYRRNDVLSRMYRFGYITQEQYIEAKSEDLVLRSGNSELASSNIKFHGPYSYAIKSTERILMDVYGYDSSTARAAIRNHGFTITTTIDSNLQQAAENSINNNPYPRDAKDDDGNLIPAQASATLIDNNTGEIIALVTGRNAHVRDNASLRPIESFRQTGSSIKPVYSYAPAIEKRLLFPGSVLDDAPIRRVNPGQRDYTPENFHSYGFNGLVTVREALRTSYNIPAILAIEDTGEIYSREFAYNLGLSQYDSSKTLGFGSSAALGTNGSTNLEMTSAFSAFANNGVQAEPYFISEIKDRNGRVIYSAEPKSKIVMSEETAFLVNSMLQDVVTAGTARRIITRGNFTKTAAAKTGTSNDGKDGWLIGYTPNYSLGIWMGWDLYEGSVVDPPGFTAKMWADIMNAAHKDIPDTPFKKPSNIVEVAVSTKSGKLPSPLTPTNFIRTDYFIRGYEPTEIDDAFVEVTICKECGLLATDETPFHLRVTKVMLRQRDYIITTDEWRDGPGNFPKDVSIMAPKEECQMHLGSGGGSIIPSGLTHEFTRNGIRLRWNGSDSVVGFNIYRSSKDDEVKRLNGAPVNVKEFLDNSAKKDVEYTYYVTAITDDGDETRNSNQIKVSLPSSVQSVRNFDLEDSSRGVIISWNEALNAKQYKILRSTEPGSGFTEITKTNRTNYIDTSVDRNTTYYYQIKAEGAEPSPTKSIDYKGPGNGNGDDDDDDDDDDDENNGD